ncbi:MAG: hypothetical protein VYC82_02790 [Verrucomicrobiota bacterium]|nr:hypothetical protein [Verrucomicrobiota bacterium]
MNTEIESSLYWLRTISDWGMLLLIWVVQLCIYPSFRNVKERAFVGWHRRYMRLISCLVGPLMGGQLLAGIGFLFVSISLTNALYMALVIATWMLTGLVAAPLHKKLQETGKGSETISRLIAWNWPRTITWTAIVFV